MRLRALEGQGVPLEDAIATARDLATQEGDIVVLDLATLDMRTGVVRGTPVYASLGEGGKSPGVVQATWAPPNHPLDRP